MFSLFKNNYYNQKLLIINFIILFCEYHFPRLKHHQLLIFILVLLIENICDRKVKDVSFHSNFRKEIIINKKKS